MKKLIRMAAISIFTWAAVTYAWAAFSHVTGFVGPAQASEVSLGYVANAVDFLDAPGLVGAPQRFASQRLRSAADLAGDVHHAMEHDMSDLVDRLGHWRAHRGERRHRHRHRHETKDVVIHLNQEADGERRVIRLERHRELAERHRERAEQMRERARRHAERVRERVERDRERILRHAEEVQREAIELRLDGQKQWEHRMWVDGNEIKIDLNLEDLDFDGDFDLQIWDREQMTSQMRDARRAAAQIEMEALQNALESIEQNASASIDKDKLKERLEKILDEIKDIVEDG